MSTPVILIAAAAAIGVGLVVFGILGPGRAAASAEPSARVTYRTLADVREQLRRRFEPTGAPVWIAANQKVNSLAADLASADLQLRPYEFRLVQTASALLFALIALLRFGISIPVVILAIIGFALPALYLRNRRGHRLAQFETELPRAMELMANSMKAGQSIAQSLRAVTENASPPVSDEFGLARTEMELGASVESALGNMVKRIGSSDLRLVVMVITIQHSVGGDLLPILVGVVAAAGVWLLAAGIVSARAGDATMLARQRLARQDIGLGQSAVALELEKPFIERLMAPARRWFTRQMNRLTPTTQAA